MIGAIRARRTRLVALLTCILAAAIVWSYSRTYAAPPPSPHPKTPRLPRDITVIIRQFEDFSHDLGETTRAWSSVLGGAPILILNERPLYPPVNSIRNSTVRVFSLEFSLEASPRDLDPLTHVRSDFVLFVPDGSRPPSKRTLKSLLAKAVDTTYHTAIVLPGSKEQPCQVIHWEYKDWTLRYEKAGGVTQCDSVLSRHALLIRTSLLRELPRPFVLPFPESLYLQTSARHVKLHVHPEARLSSGTWPPLGAALRARAARLQRERRVALYRQLGVKKLVKQDGDVQWYGCTRDTERCFPAAPGLPSSLGPERHTPPCCLRHLHRATRHAVRALTAAGARCWLEGGTLAGAVDRGSLLPTSDRSEVGVHRGDVGLVSWLRLADERGQVTDKDGFVWERATQGHYYRVAYSAINRIYVDILPFLPRNGTMTKDGWFLEHQREFPEHYLHPMSSVRLSGVSVPAPNNVREFLQVKFG